MHGAGHAIERASKLMALTGLVLIAGDITRSGGRRETEELIDAVEKNNGRILAVHGNWDLAGVKDFLEEGGYSLHAGGKAIGRHPLTANNEVKGFRRFSIVTHSARSGCRVGARHDSYIKPGRTFVGPGMTSPLRHDVHFTPLRHSGQAQRDPESIPNTPLFSQKRRISSQTTPHDLVIWPEGVSPIPYRNAFSEVWMPGRCPA